MKPLRRLLPCAIWTLLACGGDATDPSEPIDGALEVSASTTGPDPDPDGYSVVVDADSAGVLAPNGSDTVGSLIPGTHSVQLAGVAANCLLSGENPRPVSIGPGAMVSIQFDITCSEMKVVPPGKDIALTWNGEVYLLSADGATFVNLTDNPADDASPAWSPDGRKIAFSSDRTGTHHIFLMNADGSGITQLTNGEFETDPEWSGDGEKIAFSARSMGHRHIFVTDIDGGGMTQWTNGDFDVDPSWTSDGSYIVFTGGTTNLDLYAANGLDATLGIFQPTRLTFDPGQDENPAYNPSGTKLAFHSDRSGNMQVFLMNPTLYGQDIEQLTFGAANGSPDWSPDGSKIAFISNRTGISRLYMMNSDGTGQVPLTPGLEMLGTPAWRP